MEESTVIGDSQKKRNPPPCTHSPGLLSQAPALQGLTLSGLPPQHLGQVLSAACTPPHLPTYASTLCLRDLGHSPLLPGPGKRSYRNPSLKFARCFLSLVKLLLGKWASKAISGNPKPSCLKIVSMGNYVPSSRQLT